MITNNHDGTNPSMEEKILQWASENITRQDIGVNSRQVLNVVFSADRNFYDKKFAFVGTQMSLNGPEPPRIEDAFSTGCYDFQVVVRALDGTFIRAVFRLHVTPDWEGLSMQRIE